MKPQLDNKVLASFYQWLDYVLTKDGEAFVNKTGKLYPQEDERIGGLFKYASPHKQWVCDKAATGANIPSGVSIGGTPTPFNSGTLFADWKNGRIMSTTEITSEIVADYAVKNFNVYITNESEENLIFQNKFELNDFYPLTEKGIAPYGIVLPACFIIFNTTESEPYAIGSSDFQEEKFKVRVVIATDRVDHLDGCISLFRQKKDKCFPLLDYKDDPFNEYGAIKSSFPSGYNYEDMVASEDRELVNIQNVKSSKMFAASSEFMPQALQVGFLSFDLKYFRNPN